jgi:hypothetical protein
MGTLLNMTGQFEPKTKGDRTTAGRDYRSYHYFPNLGTNRKSGQWGGFGGIVHVGGTMVLP